MVRNFCRGPSSSDTSFRLHGRAVVAGGSRGTASGERRVVAGGGRGTASGERSMVTGLVYPRDRRQRADAAPCKIIHLRIIDIIRNTIRRTTDHHCVRDGTQVCHFMALHRDNWM